MYIIEALVELLAVVVFCSPRLIPTKIQQGLVIDLNIARKVISEFENKEYYCIFFLVIVAVTANAEESYASGDIAKRFPGVAMTADETEEAQMQGECLVGLKELNFKKKNKFDAIAEWTNYRTISLLEQFPPCDVLVMMEVAKLKLHVAK